MQQGDGEHGHLLSVLPLLPDYPAKYLSEAFVIRKLKKLESKVRNADRIMGEPCGGSFLIKNRLYAVASVRPIDL